MSVRGKPPPPAADDDPYLEWDDAPQTVSEEHRHRLDTPSRDLSALARVTSNAGGDAAALIYSEGQEDAIRALYALFREKAPRTGMTEDDIDRVALGVRARLTRL